MNVDEGQVTDAGEGAEDAELGEGAAAPSDDKVTALEQQVQELKAALESQNQPETEEVFEPKPLFTDEEFSQIDDEQKALYRALNESHLSNQKLEHRIEQIEAGNEVVGQERNIENYIASNAKLAEDPKLARQFKETVSAVMKGDGAELLEALALKVISQSKGKVDKTGSTSKGIQTAKERILENISKAKL